MSKAPLTIDPEGRWMAEVQRCRPYLEAAMAFGDSHTFTSIVQGLVAGRLLLWPGERSALLCEWQDGPRPVLHYFLGGGEMDEIARMEAEVTEWAKGMGFKRLTLYGRPGWCRSFLRERGWKSKWVVMEKEI